MAQGRKALRPRLGERRTQLQVHSSRHQKSLSLSKGMNMADTAGTGNTAPVLTTVTVLVFLWALVAYFIRLYVKLSQSDGWKTDDWAISAAVVSL